jgi:hypothetical protein
MSATGLQHYQPRPTGPRVEALPKEGFQVLGLRDLSPIFRTRQQAEDWLQLQLGGLPEWLRPRLRGCLRCSKGFESDGPHNRMCDDCRAAASAEQPVTFSFGTIHRKKRA